MFKIKKEKVEIADESGNKDVYEIGPLTGEYLGDLYYIIDKFQEASNGIEEESTEGNDKMLKVLGSDVSKKLHNLVFQSLIMSYPDANKTEMSQFVSQNLMKFMEPLIKINMPNDN